MPRANPQALEPGPTTGPADDDTTSGQAEIRGSIAGKADTPPPAHGATAAARPPAAKQAPPAAPPMWSFPAGTIAGRDPAAARKPLEAPAAPSLGPEGRRRSPMMLVLLSVLTLGVYTLIWHGRINTEIGDFDTRMYVRPGRSTLAIGVAWLIGVLVSIAGAVLIVTSQMQVSLPISVPLSPLEQYLLLGGIVVIPYLILAIPFSQLAAVMTLERVRIAEDRAGRTTDAQLRPVRALWWLAVPVAGGLVLVASVQRRLNRVWLTVSPPAMARISRF